LGGSVTQPLMAANRTRPSNAAACFAFSIRNSL
jgi:hypothetical protein